MAASVSFLNSALDGAINEVINDWGTINVALYSGVTEVSGGGYARLPISGWSSASSALKAATHRVNFTPNGINWTYDNIYLYGTGSTVLHSVAVSQTTITDGNTHQILVTISGTGV